jgi:hypothetical protein
MKFYRYVISANYLNKIENNNLTAIYSNVCDSVFFIKNAKQHNPKNFSYIRYDKKYKKFCLNSKYYGSEEDFTKESWRRFFKLKAFL